MLCASDLLRFPHPPPASALLPVQRCLQHLPVRDRSFIILAVQAQCLSVARHRHGCCVLQRCLDSGTEEQREALTAEIIEHALALMQVCGPPPGARSFVPLFLPSSPSLQAWALSCVPLPLVCAVHPRTPLAIT